MNWIDVKEGIPEYSKDVLIQYTNDCFSCNRNT